MSTDIRLAPWVIVAFYEDQSAVGRKLGTPGECYRKIRCTTTKMYAHFRIDVLRENGCQKNQNGDDHLHVCTIGVEAHVELSCRSRGSWFHNFKTVNRTSYGLASGGYRGFTANG